MFMLLFIMVVMILMLDRRAKAPTKKEQQHECVCFAGTGISIENIMDAIIKAVCITVIYKSLSCCVVLRWAVLHYTFVYVIVYYSIIHYTMLYSYHTIHQICVRIISYRSRSYHTIHLLILYRTHCKVSDSHVILYKLFGTGVARWSSVPGQCP